MPDAYEATTAPTTAEDRASRAWHAHVIAALPKSIENAERWRLGLAGFVGVITATLVVRGPAETADLPPLWRWTVVLLLLAGVIVSIAALWVVLDASAPAMRMRRFTKIATEWPSQRVRDVAIARRIGRQVGAAKIMMAASLVLILAAVLFWWVAPTPQPLVTVITGRGSFCGVQLSASYGELTLREPDGRILHVPFIGVQRMISGATCQ